MYQNAKKKYVKHRLIKQNTITKNLYFQCFALITYKNGNIQRKYPISEMNQYYKKNIKKKRILCVPELLKYENAKTGV